MGKKSELNYISDSTEEEKSSQAKKLKKKLKECQKEKQDYLNQAQRAQADFINYRRRQEQAIEEIKKYGQEGLIRDLLGVLDSLEMAAKVNEDFKQVKSQLLAVLKGHNLKEIEAKSKKFDPLLHEALEIIPAKGKEGTIVEEVQKGYLLGEKVLRASKVKVAQ